MSKSQNKFYVVWIGYHPGIYESWEDCKAQIDGFKGAKFKGFPDRSSALRAFKGSWSDSIKVKNRDTTRPKKVQHPKSSEVIWDSICVDAACSGSPGVMEYQGVDTTTGKLLFHRGPFVLATNNIGEFLAIVHGLALLKETKDKRPIYSDSKTALSWVRNKKVKSTLVKNTKTEKIWALVDNAERWLRENHYNNPVYKWKTDDWGEIPADFGRK